MPDDLKSSIRRALGANEPEHLVEMAVQADPENKTLHAIRAEVYQQRRGLESSLMAKGIFGAAANESLEQIDSDKS